MSTDGHSQPAWLAAAVVVVVIDCSGVWLVAVVVLGGVDGRMSVCVCVRVCVGGGGGNVRKRVPRQMRPSHGTVDSRCSIAR
jgi:hypothetical protein